MYIARRVRCNGHILRRRRWVSRVCARLREARVQICDTKHGRLLAYYTPFRFLKFFSVFIYAAAVATTAALGFWHCFFSLHFFTSSSAYSISFLIHFMEAYLTSAHQSSEWKRRTRIRHRTENRNRTKTLYIRNTATGMHLSKRVARTERLRVS